MREPVKRKNTAAGNHLDGGNQTRLTTADLVILSLLAERPMHGYEVNSTLENRKIRDWAPVSRPQIYYSLDKLTRLRLIRISSEDSASAGPERRVFETTASGRERLANALDSSHWVSGRIYQPFLIWLALSWQARPSTFRKQLKNRKKFLEQRLTIECATLKEVMTEVGHPFHEAVWMLDLIIKQLKGEIEWCEQILLEASRRAPASNKQAPDNPSDSGRDIAS
jgi:DNA-binding PadR family transcriptional regulator